MKAVTDFAATREQIAFAKEIFATGFAQRREEAAQKREEWIADFQRKAWFGKSYARAEKASRGDTGDIFDKLRMTDFFEHQVTNYFWFEARLEQATQLLQKFDCAVDTCEAVDVILSDKDLTLLSVSLQSALDN